MLAVWTVVFSVIGAINGIILCPKHLGCFSSEDPYGGTPERPLNLVPPSPEVLFNLITREDHVRQQIDPMNPSTISSSNFNSSAKSVIIIHGYLGSSNDPWMYDICKAIFEVENINCILVDWSSMSTAIFHQAANIVFVVGAKIAYLLKVLEALYSYTGNNVHLIGHSLGAHIAGHAGKRFQGISRVTGLDPAGILFENTSVLVRLSKDDAEFVDVIHTDSKLFIHLGLGFIQPIGNADFYPNNGKDMPECDANRRVSPPPNIGFCILIPIIGPIDCSEGQIYAQCPTAIRNMKISEETLKAYIQLIYCDHMQAVMYYIHSITHPEAFQSKPCANCREDGEPSECPSGGCPKMGHYADPTASGEFYLETSLEMQPVPNVTEILNIVNELK